MGGKVITPLLIGRFIFWWFGVEIFSSFNCSNNKINIDYKDKERGLIKYLTESSKGQSRKVSRG